MSKSNRKSFPRPAGHHVLTPMTLVPNAIKVIEFLQQAFGGTVVEKFEAPNGALIHAEVLVGDSVMMIGDASPDRPAMPVALYYYVDDSAAVDAAFASALKAGARAEREPADQGWGYRVAGVSDSGGKQWTIATVIEQLSHD